MTHDLIPLTTLVILGLIGLWGRWADRESPHPSPTRPDTPSLETIRAERRRRWLYIWHITLRTPSLRILMYSNLPAWRQLAERDSSNVPPDWQPSAEDVASAARNFRTPHNAFYGRSD